jgi:hypothetical protein
MTIWYILCSFGTFPSFRYIVSRKIWQPCCGQPGKILSLNAVIDTRKQFVS